MWCRLIVAAAVVATAAGAGADEYRPTQGATVTLGNVSGVAYYTVEPLGYRLVATFSGKDGVPVRFIAVLQPEQSVTVSVPRGPGKPALQAVFARHGNRLSVVQTPPPDLSRIASTPTD